MAILYSEISDSGISESDFDAIAAAELGHTKQMVVYRQNPNFTLHSKISNIDTTTQGHFAAVTTAGHVFMIYHRTTTALYRASLPLESDNPSSPSSWAVTSWDTSRASSPIAMTTDGTSVRIYYILANNTLAAYSYIIGVSNTALPAPTTYTFENDTVEWLEVTEDAFGTTIYVVIPDGQDNRHVYIVGPTSLVDTGIVWPDVLTGFSVQSFIGTLDDSTDPLAGSDVRHCITLASSLPNQYQQKLVNGVPQETVVQTGGIVSYVVRPPNGDRAIQVSRFHEVQTFDQVTAVQYRQTTLLSTAASMEHPDDNQDTLWAATIGANGDMNGALPDLGFVSVYYYSSRDGKHWSQDQMIPIDDIISNFPDDLAAGVKLLVLGNYVYAVSPNYILRSLGCGQFGNPHPDLTLDVTSKVNYYNSTASDMRQDNNTLDNLNGVLYDTCLGQPGTFRLQTKIGQYVDGVNYLFQTSVQEIDTLEDPRERPQTMRMVSRDYLAQITDKATAVDAIQYDNIATGVDSYDAIGSATDAGLAHSDAVKGTWGTTDKTTTGLTFNTLDLKSRYETGIVFNTQIPGLTDDGCAQAKGVLPNPETYTSGATADNAPSFIGVTFRAIDKDNLWYCVYNYWTGLLELGYRSSGVDTVKATGTPNSAFLTAATTGQVITIRVEFVGPRVRVYFSDPGTANMMKYSFTYLMNANTQPIYKPMIGQGHIGVYGSGYSDQDQSDQEPDPTILGFDSTPTDWGSANNFVPTRGVFTMRGNPAAVWRVSGLTGTPQAVDISPTNPDASNPHDVYRDISADPWAYKRILISDKTSILGLDNFKSKSAPGLWDRIYITDASTNPYNTDRPIIRTKIKGSINRQGWFGWIEEVGADPITHVDTFRFCYTTDNFATVQFSAFELGRADGFTVMWDFAVGCFNTSTYGLVVASGFRGPAGVGADPSTFVSLDWGVTWDYMPGHIGNPTPRTGVLWGGPLCIGYSLRGGGENRTNEIFIPSSNNNAPSGVFLPDGTRLATTTQPIVAPFFQTFFGLNNSYTLDSNIQYAGYNNQGPGGGMYRTRDGWQTFDTVGVNGFAPLCINGWPTNPDYLLVCSNTGGVSYSAQRGDAPSWVQIILSYPGGGSGILDAEAGIADLTELYDTEVHLT